MMRIFRRELLVIIIVLAVQMAIFFIMKLIEIPDYFIGLLVGAIGVGVAIIAREEIYK